MVYVVCPDRGLIVDITLSQMAIADAVLDHLVSSVKCKTLFITHYPLVAEALEKKHPADVQNLHMGFREESRIDGTREITFLYRLTPGMATESFGVECARLAGLPEKLLEVATKRSQSFQATVQERVKQNK
jgi:DNA mismatch repair protein MSH3